MPRMTDDEKKQARQHIHEMRAAAELFEMQKLRVEASLRDAIEWREKLCRKT